jgi:hypothetical protein
LQSATDALPTRHQYRQRSNSVAKGIFQTG